MAGSSKKTRSRRGRRARRRSRHRRQLLPAAAISCRSSTSQPDEAGDLIDRTIRLKRGELDGRRTSLLLGRTLGLVFEKPSLRTRVSFEAAMARLGGSSIFLRGKDVGLGVRESVADFARVISQYVDVLAIRTFSQAIVEELARHATIPVINALSDSSHPCQAMADMVTIHEQCGSLAGKKLVFVGDGNNVARSLALASALAGPGVRPDRAGGLRVSGRVCRPVRGAVSQGRRSTSSPTRARPSRGPTSFTPTSGPAWARSTRPTSAGRSSPHTRSNEALMARARGDAIFLHCLPAHRGEEVTSGVLDGPHSRVIPQAANRMHFQMALLLWLLGRWTDLGSHRATGPS